MRTTRIQILAWASCVLFLIAVSSSTSHAQTSPSVERDGSRGISPAQAKQEIDAIVKDLRDARASAGRINDRAIREKIEGLLSRAELRARDLSDALARTRPSQSQAAAPLPAEQFEKLLKGLKNEAFDEGKLTYIENFASRVPLSCAQAAALLSCFAFDVKRIEAIKPIYPNLVDPLNFNDVLAVYKFSSSRAEARRAVGLK